MVDKYDKETRQVYINEMIGTKGWEILKEELLHRRKQSVNRLTTGSPSNISLDEVIVNRSRIKLVDEILASVDDSKEEKYE